MAKVYLKCGLNQNLGDDLFFKVITERYQDQFVVLTSNKNYRSNNHVEVISVNSFFYRIFNKLSTIVKKRHFLEDYYIKKSDYTVVIGGSIFMESVFTYNYLRKFYDNLEKYYILGANIGPYHTKTYLNYIKNTVFKNATDVCLRDQASYQLVKEIDTVRVASDLLFSLDINKYVKNNKKKVIISVIDYEKKEKQFNQGSRSDFYYETIVNIIEFYKAKKYQIALMSFCKSEGDEDAIRKILEKIKDNGEIEIFCYNGEIEKAIEFLSNSEIIVGTRFHANVLGFLLKKEVIPIIYNDKTRNLLKDIAFENIQIDLNYDTNFDIIDLEKGTYVYPDLNEVVLSSQKHFAKLDKVLTKKGDKYDNNQKYKNCRENTNK